MKRCAAFAVGLLVCCGSAQAQPTAATLDTARLAAFADGVLPPEMAKRHIPGAVLVVVNVGAVALARGYGLADIAAQRRVDPDRTRFRLASVAKVITATAGLQLVEQGRLSLTQDVNAVLRDFKLPAVFSVPPLAGAPGVPVLNRACSYDAPPSHSRCWPFQRWQATGG